MVHHVMRQMAVQHPTARVDGVEFDVARLRHTYQHSVGWEPSRLRDAASLRTSDVKLRAVNVHGVMVHAEVDHANSHSLAELDDHRRRRRPGLAVDRQPVELHRPSIVQGSLGMSGVCTGTTPVGIWV